MQNLVVYFLFKKSKSPSVWAVQARHVVMMTEKICYKQPIQCMVDGHRERLCTVNIHINLR